MFQVNPNISDYMKFVPGDIMADLTAIDQVGNYRVQLEYSSTLVKLYILNNWQVYRDAGVDDERLWQALAALTNDEGHLKFNAYGTQLNYIRPLRQLNGSVLGNLALQNLSDNYMLFIASVVLLLFSAVVVGGLIVVDGGGSSSIRSSSDATILQQLFASSVN